MGKNADTNTGTTTGPNTKRPVATGGAAKIDGDGLRFDLLYSAIYYDRMEARLTMTGRLLLFANIMLGSAAAAAFGASYPLVGQIGGVAVAVISTASMVWDFAGRARDHGCLRRGYYGLIEQLDQGATAAGLRASMSRLCADEPPMNNRVRDRAYDLAGRSLFGSNFKRARDNS